MSVFPETITSVVSAESEIAIVCHLSHWGRFWKTTTRDQRLLIRGHITTKFCARVGFEPWPLEWKPKVLSTWPQNQDIISALCVHLKGRVSISLTTYCTFATAETFEVSNKDGANVAIFPQKQINIIWTRPLAHKTANWCVLPSVKWKWCDRHIRTL